MSDPTPSKPAGLWARLFNVEPERDETVPLAVPVETADESAPLAEPVRAEPVPQSDEGSTEMDHEALFPSAPVDEAPAPCPCCASPRVPNQAFCGDCGWMFTAGNGAPVPAALPASISSPLPKENMPAASAGLLRNRYALHQEVGDRLGTKRYRGFDHDTSRSVVIVATPAASAPVAEAEPVAAAVVVDDEILPGFDDDVPVAAMIVDEPSGTAWPSAGWEKLLLEKINHPALPRVLDSFVEEGTSYLIEEQLEGRGLWDVWDDPDAGADVRYGWAIQIAQGLQALHQAGAMLEGVRPDFIVVNDAGQALFADLSDLLPLAVPAGAPIRSTLYTAPELIATPQTADARSELYSFGALLYSLEYLHHPLEEKDFERPHTPLQITERFPDVHPLFLRLINKTFVKDLGTRFPTDEAGKTDPSGIGELIKSLDVCKRTFDNVRLDIAAWTTTGMVRTGNEDTLAFLHGVETRQDELYEYAMVLLCDGMGGYEAGEVAAAMAVGEMRKFLLQQPLFSALIGKEPPSDPADPKAYQKVLEAALKHANKEVFTASRVPGKGRRGMGCTAEAVYIDAKNVIVGHVGDSRTYHLHKGRLVQLTRDQTLVNRLVELGQLSAAEAEDHPRKNELQQAIGGQPDVMPGTYSGKLQRGDWVLVCSDGLSNHISNQELEKMLTREAASSAEEAARRLLNLVNLRGATDNATIVVVRAS